VPQLQWTWEHQPPQDIYRPVITTIYHYPRTNPQGTMNN
jgi:hypothetical protein